MNIWGKNERSWRRKNRRAVSPIIATILLVAITVVLAAVLYILIQQYTKGGANSAPLGSAFEFGTSVDASAGTINYYNMTIESASSTLTFGNLLFELKSPSGSIFVTGAAVVLINPLGSTEGAFCLGVITTSVTCAAANANAWVFNGAHCAAPAYTSTCASTSSVNTQAFISVQVTPTTVSLTGYTLYALGQGSYQGTVSGAIT